jgi:hypothetical protein
MDGCPLVFQHCELKKGEKGGISNQRHMPEQDPGPKVNKNFK